MCDNRRRTYCCVFGCLNNSSISELSMFRLPSEQERRLQWLRLIDREDLINKSHPKHVVCEAHFHPDDIIKNKVRKLLKKNRSPSLNLPNLNKVDKHTQVEITTSYNKSSQTETTSASGSNGIDLIIATSSCQTDINTSDNLTQTTAGLSAPTIKEEPEEITFVEIDTKEDIDLHLFEDTHSCSDAKKTKISSIEEPCQQQLVSCPYDPDHVIKTEVTDAQDQDKSEVESLRIALNKKEAMFKVTLSLFNNLRKKITWLEQEKERLSEELSIYKGQD